MTVYIHDASILLNLIHTDLLRLFLSIPASMVTTDSVVGEITEAADAAELAAAMRSGALEALTSGLAEIDSIGAIQASHRAL